MKNRTAVMMLVAGLVAGLALGTTALGFAATRQAATQMTAASASTSPTPSPRGDGGPGGFDGHMGDRGPGGRGMFGVGMVDVVAKLTGETTTTVAAARAKGTSFAKIASAKSVTVEQIVTLSMAAPKAALDSEVSNGLITQAKADTELAELKTRVTAEVNDTNVRPARDGRGHDGPPPAGQAPQGTAPSSGTGSTSSSGASN